MFARFFFPDVQSAAEGLILLLEHARASADNFSFGPRDVAQIFDSGLWLDGEIQPLVDIIGRLPGVIRNDE